MKVLIVDDDRSLREALRRALTLGGFETVSPGAGRRRSPGRDGPDAVVLDVGLPGIDGLEVCRRCVRRATACPC